MPYSPTTWQERATSLGPTNMNKLELGLAAATKGFYSVAEHGAVGDGIADDTAAIIEADAVCADNDGTLIIPQGTYLCQGLQLRSKRIIGQGAMLRLKSGGSTAILNGGFTNGTHISGVTFDCVSQTNSICIALSPNGLDGIEIESCMFLNAKYGVNATNTGYDLTKVNVHNCTFNTVIGWGILLNNVDLSELNVSFNYFLGGSTGSGIDINVPSGSLSGATIEGNLIRDYSSTNTNGGFAIDVAGMTATPVSANINDVSIVGNRTYNCNGDGIHVEGAVSNITIQGNTSRNCGGPGIQVVSNVTGGGDPFDTISIVGNTVLGCSSIRVTIGAGIAVSNSTAFQGITIEANIVRGCGNNGVSGRGINVQAAGYALIAGNSVSNTIGNAASNAGIGVLGSSTATPAIFSNRCWDDQGVKTQQYGLVVSSGTATIGDNEFSGNGTGDIFWNGGNASGRSRMSGAGTPLSVVPAQVGATWQRTDGGASTTLYVKESGAGTNTGWVAK